MLKFSYTLPKYNYAMYLLNLEVRRGLEKADEVIGDIPSAPTSHGGVIRQVTEPKIVETPMKKFAAEVTVEGEWLRKTDVDIFTGILWQYCQVLISQLKKYLFETVSKITDATGNVSSVQPGKNIWDAQIEAMRRQEMRFDKEGNHGYKFYAHPDDAAKYGAPTPEQIKELEELIKAKREEYYAKKRTRRLS
jgi:hypothetical protein